MKRAANGLDIDWGRLRSQMDEQGYGLTGEILSPDECRELIAMYEDAKLFRSRIDMARYNFGSGEYQYFEYPLPPLVAELRSRFYAGLVDVAREWQRALSGGEQPPECYPGSLDEFLAGCHSAGQTRPTPLLLRYRSGDYNCLHQDLYGEHVFPIQVAILLSEPGRDFEGGEFVLTHQRPRMQSRADVVPLGRGHGVAFAVNQRPVPGRRGISRAHLRHGVSRVRSGERYTLGVILHDAR